MRCRSSPLFVACHTNSMLNGARVPLPMWCMPGLTVRRCFRFLTGIGPPALQASAARIADFDRAWDSAKASSLTVCVYTMVTLCAWCHPTTSRIRFSTARLQRALCTSACGRFWYRTSVPCVSWRAWEARCKCCACVVVSTAYRIAVLCRNHDRDVTGLAHRCHHAAP